MASVIPTTSTKSLESQVLLFPWDPTSPKHVERLVQQRITCGWDHEAVEGWKAAQESGNLNLQWIVGTLPHFTSHFWDFDFPRFSKIPIQRKMPNHSSMLRRIPKNKNRWLIRRFLLGGNLELFPRHKKLSPQ